MLTVRPCLSVTLSYFLASSSAGDYEISVKFNDQHIPDSPYLVPVVAPVNDARRLTVAGLQVRHEETPPHSPVLLKGSGAQLHKNVTSMERFYFHTEQLVDTRSNSRRMVFFMQLAPGCDQSQAKETEPDQREVLTETSNMEMSWAQTLY